MTWRFLIDANVPVALARAVDAAGCAATHVDDLGKDWDDDVDIWRTAAERKEVIIRKDADFVVLAQASDSGQAFAGSGVGNTPKRTLIARVLHAMPEIVSALESGERIIEVR